ncbi:uncharacterized protein LOC112679542 isoform X2 [Sipha flava]|uniref:Uncharacterized protein LOC112679542 isoform X2 n=1 Tax=Sipha flava TaxID=143950 RepID=A0A8B8F3B8_9HEMI|nr:uncharacterized protein LOC112679542 isoform X2 [Sipha flava]
MPKKRINTNDKPIQRPQRNMKAKKVFDPSDNYLPKKRNKYSSSKPVNFIKSNNVKNRNKKKKQKAIDKNSLKNDLSECSAEESIPESEHSYSPSNPPISPTEITQKKMADDCFMCNTIGDINDIIDCPICLIKVHKDCLVIKEPMWKFKLDLCPWLCESCRQFHCCQCLKSETDSEFLSCITCKVGLHSNCIESCRIKPLETIRNLGIFVCIPCLTLATDRLPEEEEEEEEEERWHEIEMEEIDEKAVEEEEEEENERVLDESDEEKFEKEEVEEESEEEIEFVNTSSDENNMEDNDNNSINSDKSYNSSIDYEKEFTEVPNVNIPNVTRWNKYQVYEYLADRLPKEEIDGRALQLLRRSDITLHMGLKLGHAMKLYKQVRILQTQSTYHKTYWE